VESPLAAGVYWHLGAGLLADFGAKMTRQRAPGHTGALAACRQARAISGSARHRKAGRQMHAGDFTREAKWIGKGIAPGFSKSSVDAAHRLVVGDDPINSTGQLPQLQESHPRSFAAPRALCRSFGHFIMSSSGFESLDRKPVVVGAGDLDKACEQ
jgi:hypothetical protein